MKDKKWKKNSYIDGINLAIMGIVDAIRTEYHMKFHCFCTVIIIVLCLLMNLPKLDILLLSISISLVWVTELINTAIETAVDLVTTEFNLLAKRAKDVASGAVLVSAINALIVGFFVFEKKIEVNFVESFYRIRGSNQRMLLFILLVIVILVISLKIIFKRGTPLSGGLPSGHSALGASLFTIIVSLTNSYQIFVLTFLMLILIIQSRIEGKIHTVFETVLGAFLGWIITYFLLMFFKSSF
ncbi:diacylglycerol kinase [Fusobacterium sp. PH5-44]|uniref:diacylglycerol kinase n=1 Tax=unclassified Fusobacterium TaxID=2648384 RepID=UPI003D198166